MGGTEAVSARPIRAQDIRNYVSFVPDRSVAPDGGLMPCLDVVFADIFSSSFYSICNRIVHIANSERCYFLPCAYFYYEVVRNYDVTERFLINDVSIQ